MPVVETKRPDIRALRGLHLFHFATSNCSQRVRLVLEEKGLRWTGHHVDLAKFENASADFVALNPRGVVPVLVHDGVTIVESIDIIRYLEELFPEPRLTPCDAGDRRYLDDSLERSAEIQASLKLLMHEFLFKPFRRMSPQQLDRYRAATRQPSLIAFMEDFSSPGGFGRDRILGAIEDMENVMETLEVRLSSRSWLSGDGHGLADIAWIVNLHRFGLMAFPMRRYRRLNQWISRMRNRPAYRRAVRNFDSGKLRSLFRAYTALRLARGTSIRSYLD